MDVENERFALGRRSEYREDLIELRWLLSEVDRVEVKTKKTREARESERHGGYPRLVRASAVDLQNAYSVCVERG